MITIAAVAGGVALILLWIAGVNVRVIRQFERGVVYRFGRVQPRVREPG